jgi:hypothetical protein
MFRISQFQPMFSPIIQQTLNTIWLAQILISLLYCVCKKKWIPSFLNGKKHRLSIYESQFHSVLWAHFVFYIAELMYTEMWKRERFMAYHHLSSVVLLPLSSYHLDQFISVLFITPFALHSFYWSFQDPPFLIVVVYNVSLAVACFYVIYRYSKLHTISKKYILKSPIMIPLAGIAIGFANACTFITRSFNKWG